MPQKRLLYEISIIRPTVIFLLVVYHALCIYTGGWKVPAGVEANSLYWWIGHLISGFRIETIALVGGYVFAYQCIELGRRSSFPRFAWKKLKRLIIPCVIFGFAYWLIFCWRGTWPWARLPWYLLNGMSHLWFLPMLFWCFLASWCFDGLLHRIGQKSPKTMEIVGWLLLVALAMFSFWTPKPFRLGLTRVPHFLFYFYMGYWLRHKMAGRESQPSGKRYLQLSVALAVSYLFILCFRLQVCCAQLPGMPWGRPEWMAGWSKMVIAVLAFFRTIAGILALFFFVWYLLYGGSPTEDRALRQPGPRLREASRVCYGVYVYHMFFMEGLYYFCPLPRLMASSAFGAWMLPWVVCLITFLASYASTWLTLKTRFGRFLIG